MSGASCYSCGLQVIYSEKVITRVDPRILSLLALFLIQLILGAGTSARADTCFTPEEALSSLGPYEHVLSSQHFAVHFDVDESQGVVQQRVEELLAWLEESLEVMTNDLGFYPPELINDYQLLVAVEHLPSPTTGAFTSLTSCGLSGEMAYMVLNAQWFSDDQKLKSLAPHELFHAIQVRYAYEPFWGEADGPNRWWVEASAAYMEWVVYPELDERQKEHALQWTREPWRALQSHDSSGFQYGAWLLAASIEESLASGEWHQELWDGFLGRDDLNVIEDLDSILSVSDSSFAAEYGLFIERAATMDFDFSEDLDTPAAVWDAGEGGLVASHSAAELPIDAIILATSSPPAPQTLGTSYVRVGAPDSAQALRIDVETLPDSTGSSRAFELRLIAIEESEAGLTHHLDLVPRVGSAGTEAGSILLDSFGGTYQSLIIAASPTLPSTDGDNASWSYSLSLIEAQGGVGFIAVDGPGTLGGCESCSQVSSDPSSRRARMTLALLGLCLLVARRREGRPSRL